MVLSHDYNIQKYNARVSTVIGKNHLNPQQSVDTIAWAPCLMEVHVF